MKLRKIPWTPFDPEHTPSDMQQQQDRFNEQLKLLQSFKDKDSQIAFMQAVSK